MGRTIDDAAGEGIRQRRADARPGYPGGPLVDAAARKGPTAIDFPDPGVRTGELDFSFSGLKTSLLYHLQGMTAKAIAEQQADLAASIREAIVDVLVRQAFAAVERAGFPHLQS